MAKLNETIAFILKENILDKKALKAALEKQKQTGQSLVGILKKDKLVNEEQLTRIIAAANKIEFINLSPDMVDPMAAHLVSSEIANQYTMIPYKQDENQLYVAMSEPLNIAARDQIEIRTGYTVIPVAATPNAIRQAIRYHFNVRNATRQAIVSMRLKSDAKKEKEKSKSGESKSIRVTNDPITKLVSSIIYGAIDSGASDIHIEPQQPDMRIRYRVDGLLHNAIEVPSSVQLEVISHIKVLADMDISEKRIPQDGHIQMQHDNKIYDLRISSLPSVGGEKIVIRILDKSSNKWSLDNVVSSDKDREKFYSLLKNPYGMILMTGPTGCGKTTTLYSLLQILNKPEKNIVTVEDPVEYRLDGITQVQVLPVAGRTFASALRSILRQDPDIILVGEIRDLETAEIAISAALTGHLVLSTLHTNDAAGAISRLINLGVQPFLVSSAILGTVAQRLIRTVCPKCKSVYQPNAEEKDILQSATDPISSKAKLYKGKGCDNCYQMGYSGRKAIYEILSVSKDIKDMIVSGKSDLEIKRQAVKEGMKTLFRSGLEDIYAGQTTLEEIMRVVDVRDVE